MSLVLWCAPSHAHTCLVEQKTASGIFLPTSATSTPLPEGTVIAVGPGAPNKDGKVIPTTVKAGDRVLLPGWGGNSIKVGDEVRVTYGIPHRQQSLTPGSLRQEYYLYKDAEILAKIEE